MAVRSTVREENYLLPNPVSRKLFTAASIRGWLEENGGGKKFESNPQMYHSLGLPCNLLLMQPTSLANPAQDDTGLLGDNSIMAVPHFEKAGLTCYTVPFPVFGQQEDGQIEERKKARLDEICHK